MIMVDNNFIVYDHWLNTPWLHYFSKKCLIDPLPFSFQLIDGGGQTTELQQILKTLLLDKLDYLHI